jgi:hypothetical protein
MKKITKFVMGVVALATLSAGALGFTACGEKTTTGEAYAPSHGGSFIGYSKITVKGDKVTDLTLTEVCYPTQVTVAKTTSQVSAEDAVGKISTTVAASDYVIVNTSTTTDQGTDKEKTTYTATAYYKTVSYSGHEFTYDATAKAYQLSDGTTFGDYMRVESNAKEYYEAVVGNSISVTVGGVAKTDILSYNTLSKEVNGYWPKTYGENDTSYSRWKVNRDATINYVKENGVSKLSSLKLSTEKVEDAYGVQATYWTDGTVSTGATWSDLYKDNGSSVGYLTYGQLILKAYCQAQGTVYEGEYSYSYRDINYGVKVQVAVYDGKIIDVTIVNSDLKQLSDANPLYGWTEDNRTNYKTNEAKLLEAYNGKTVAAVKAATASISGVEDAEENKVSDSDLLLTGATQCSARILKAVQNALKDVN